MNWKLSAPSAWIPGILRILRRMALYGLAATVVISGLLLILPNAVGIGYSMLGLPFYSMFCGPNSSSWQSTFTSRPASSEGYYEFLLFATSREECTQDYLNGSHLERPEQPSGYQPPSNAGPADFPPGTVATAPVQKSIREASQARTKRTPPPGTDQPLSDVEKALAQQKALVGSAYTLETQTSQSNTQLLAGTEFARYNDTYAGLSQFWGNDIVSHFFETLMNIAFLRFKEGVQTGAVVLVNFLCERAIFPAIYYLLYTIFSAIIAKVFGDTISHFTRRMWNRALSE